MAVAPRGAKKVKEYKRAHQRVVGEARVYKKNEKPGARKKGVNKKIGKTPGLLARLHLGLIVKLGVATCVAYGLGWQVNWSGLTERMHAAVNKPVASISVKGEFKYLLQSDIRSLVLAHINGNFVDIDLTLLRENLQKNPWVKTAMVQRVWPDGLQIEVKEQKPIARWGKDGLINNEGGHITIGDNSRLAGLPLLSGPESQKQQITRTYMDMTEMLASHNLTLTGVHVDNTLSWRVKLSNGIELVFGQYDVLTKLRNFMLVYDKQLQSVSDQVVRVDMRYDNGMAVAWREQKQPELQASR